MKIALHTPCYVTLTNPKIISSSVAVLKHFNLKVEIPNNQTCCGQPFINSGIETTLPKEYEKIFNGFDYIISPSSSCTYTIKNQNLSISNRTYELCEFLVDILKVKNLAKNYPKKIALHNSCHSLRGLCEATPSEVNKPYFNKIKELLGCKVFEAKRDECCGFGGVFSLKEGFISYVMGKDKLEDLLSTKADVITGVDYSCLMHLESIAKKENIDIEFKHISEILAECLNETL